MVAALVEVERAERQKTSRTAFEFASASAAVLSCLKKPENRFSNTQKPPRERFRLTSGSGT
jgi:hypothetical protein